MEQFGIFPQKTYRQPYWKPYCRFTNFLVIPMPRWYKYQINQEFFLKIWNNLKVFPKTYWRPYWKPYCRFTNFLVIPMSHCLASRTVSQDLPEKVLEFLVQFANIGKGVLPLALGNLHSALHLSFNFQTGHFNQTLNQNH